MTKQDNNLHTAQDPVFTAKTFKYKINWHYGHWSVLDVLDVYICQWFFDSLKPEQTLHFHNTVSLLDDRCVFSQRSGTGCRRAGWKLG